MSASEALLMYKICLNACVRDSHNVKKDVYFIYWVYFKDKNPGFIALGTD